MFQCIIIIKTLIKLKPTILNCRSNNSLGQQWPNSGNYVHVYHCWTNNGPSVLFTCMFFYVGPMMAQYLVYLHYLSLMAHCWANQDISLTEISCWPNIPLLSGNCLATPSHAADKPTNSVLWNSGPFFQQSIS